MNIRLTLSVCVAATIISGLLVGPAQAAEAIDAGVLLPINTLVQSLNTGDNGFKSAFATDATVVDEFAPFLWRGDNAGGKWLTDFGAFLKSVNFTQPHVTLNKVLSEQAKGDDAYVVESATFDGKMGNKPFTEQGVWTFVLHKASAHGPWVIAQVAWAKVSGG